MPASVPSVLAPYLRSCLSENSLTLLTSVLDAPANWVLPWIITAASNNVEFDAAFDPKWSINHSVDSTHHAVVFLSFVRSYDFWLELSKKIGLDLGLLVIQHRFAFVDGLTGGFTTPQSTGNCVRPKSHSLQDITSAISTAKTLLSQGTGSEPKITFIADGLDFVLASQPELSAMQLTSFLTGLQEDCPRVVVTAAADSPLLHNTEASATPLELEHSIFVRAVAHRSEWVLQLRPLETGHAKDVSGVIRASRGGADAVDDASLPESEWLYRVKGDGNVTVWGRGE